nr:MAG TPA: chromosome partition protein [Caudoviricetes sp.]
MKTVELKQIKLEEYKKFESASYQFAPRTMVSGRNRQGKSTLMDAYFDTLTGKLADGTLPNAVRRKVNEIECDEPVVRELILSVDGQEMGICKETKKGKNSNTTSYEIDGFKSNKTKFEEFLKENIADPDTLLMCSNARAFINEISKSTAAARRILSDVSGFDETQIDGYADIQNITKGHPVEEVLKKLRRDLREQDKVVSNKKAIIDNVESELEKLNLEATVDKESLLKEQSILDEKEAKIVDLSKAYETVQSEIISLKNTGNEVIQAAKEQEKNRRSKVENIIYDRKLKLQSEQNGLRTTKSIMSNMESDELLKSRVADLQAQYKAVYSSEWNDSTLKAIEAEEFNEEEAVCPTCGQKLLPEQVEKLKATFEENKQKRIAEQFEAKIKFDKDKKLNLAEIARKGNEAAAHRKQCAEDRAKLEADISEIEKRITTLTEEIQSKEEELKEIPTEVDLSANVEYQQILEDVEKKEAELAGLDNYSEQKQEIANKKLELARKISEIDTAEKLIEKQKVDKQKSISDMKEELKTLSQKAADIQKQIDQVMNFSILKNKLLAEKINPFFKHFQFKFLDYTSDNEPVEVCKMICNGIDYMNGLNHSDQILCNIDLVAGLQELNGLNLPIWVDDVESVNADRIPDTGRQMILLKVSDNELKVEGI